MESLVYRPTTPSVKGSFFTLGVVNSFTLDVVGMSVDLSQALRTFRIPQCSFRKIPFRLFEQKQLAH